MFRIVAICSILLLITQNSFSFQRDQYTVAGIYGKISIKGATEAIKKGHWLAANDTLEFDMEAVLLLTKGDREYLLQPEQKELILKAELSINYTKKVIMVLRDLYPIKKVLAANRGEIFSDYVSFLEDNTFTALDHKLVLPVPDALSNQLFFKLKDGIKPVETVDSKAIIALDNTVNGKPLRLFKKENGDYIEFASVFWVDASKDQLLAKLNFLKAVMKNADDDFLRSFITGYYGLLHEDVFQLLLDESSK